MRLFPRWHRPDSVAKQLIEGLEDGTLTLESPIVEASDIISNLITLETELYSWILPRVPECSLPNLPTAEELAELERQQPGVLQHTLSRLQVIHAEIKAIESQVGGGASRRKARLCSVIVDELVSQSREIADVLIN